MSVDRKTKSVHEVRGNYAAQPPLSHDEQVVLLRSELQKGLNSGVSHRSLQDIYEDVIAKRNAA